MKLSDTPNISLKLITFCNAIVILFISYYLLAGKTEQNPHRTSLSSEINLMSDDNSEQYELKLIANQLRSLSNELKNLKTEVNNIKQKKGQDTANITENIDYVNLRELQHKLNNDQNFANLVQDYTSQLIEEENHLIDQFFSNRQVDEQWSQEMTSFLHDAITTKNSLASSGASLAYSECKVGLCKVKFSIPESQNRSTIEQQELEDTLLISIAKKFPNAKLTRQQIDGQIELFGYITDNKTKLPEPEHILSDGRISQHELESLQQLIQ